MLHHAQITAQNWFVLWVQSHRLRKTKGTKNNNNTNAKQDHQYNTSQTIEDNLSTRTHRTTPPPPSPQMECQKYKAE